MTTRMRPALQAMQSNKMEATWAFDNLSGAELPTHLAFLPAFGWLGGERDLYLAWVTVLWGLFVIAA